MKRSEMSMPRVYRLAAAMAFGESLQSMSEYIYSELALSRPGPRDPKLRKHYYGNILPGLAIYRSFRNSGLDERAALEAMDLLFTFRSEGERRAMRRIGRLPFFYPLLMRLIKPFMGNFPASGWDTHWLELSRERIRFDMSRCYYHDSLTELGAPELTASFCRTDDLVYDGMSPSLRWMRTKTIGRGDAKCDFCFERRARGG